MVAASTFRSVRPTLPEDSNRSSASSRAPAAGPVGPENSWPKSQGPSHPITSILQRGLGAEWRKSGAWPQRKSATGKGFRASAGAGPFVDTRGRVDDVRRLQN
jgi:hypothetical protein